MQKIIINNFGAVKNAEIDIKKVLILIGEQASGKSTIAKLIYFFRSLKNDLIVQIGTNHSKENFDEQLDFIEPLSNKFYNLFGSTYHLPNFEITFYYSIEEDRYLRLTLNKNKRLNIKLSADFFNAEIKNEIKEVYDELKLLENESDRIKKMFYDISKSELIKKAYSSIKSLFNLPQTDNVFIVAGRSATVSYSDLFEKHLFTSVDNNIEKNASQSFINKVPTIDSELMLNFIKHISFIKSLRYLFTIESDEPKNNDSYDIVRKQLRLILKGRYYVDNSSERILLGNDWNLSPFVYLSNASSGQQEVIRILQDLLFITISEEKTSRIIEEPEAHLFPIAQKQLVELFALMVNQDIDNQLIITTHSPYILAAFNNLLFAKRVIDKNPNAEKEVSEIVAPEFRLEANEFAAYSLTHNAQEDYCTSIMSERGLISENYLDTVSDVLSNDFDILYNIHAQTYARR